MEIAVVICASVRVRVTCNVGFAAIVDVTLPVKLILVIAGVSLVCLPVLIGLHLRPSKFLRKILFVCLLLATIGVGLAGFYGGKLVFEYSVGVEP